VSAKPRHASRPDPPPLNPPARRPSRYGPRFPDSETVIAKSRPSVQKRLHEAAKIDKKDIKAAKRERRRLRAEARAEARDELAPTIDPDLVGITAGPQPVKEDPLDIRPEKEKEKDKATEQ